MLTPEIPHHNLSSLSLRVQFTSMGITVWHEAFVFDMCVTQKVYFSMVYIY